MSVSRWFLVAGLAIFLLAAAGTVLRLVCAFRARDFAQAKGDPGRAVLYSLTAAMLPWKKESARLHWAVYALGVAYHAGVFIAFLWVALLFLRIGPAPAGSFVQADDTGPGLSPAWATWGGASALLLAASAACGAVLLGRRIAVANLRHFSSPDDYFSNLTVTVFQALAAAVVVNRTGAAVLFVYAGLLLAYAPLGKLRHAIHFPFARMYLGLFYGRRGVWAAKGNEPWRD
jgi:nitrate reductase gamma subunit